MRTPRVERGACQSYDRLQLGATLVPAAQKRQGARKTFPNLTLFLHLEEMLAEVLTVRTRGPEPAAGEKGGSRSNGARSPAGGGEGGREREGRQRPLRAQPATHQLPRGQPLQLAVRRPPGPAAASAAGRGKLGCRRLGG